MKRWLPPEQILRLAADPAHCTRTDAAFAVDPRRPFVPETHTQLYYTPVYASLHFEHRLRYNQLSGLRINEYVMMLESDLIDGVLPPLRKLPKIARQPHLVEAIDKMIEEERRHFGMFAALNRAARPDLYPPGRGRLFSRLPPATRAMFKISALLVAHLSFPLWYMMALEESSMALARDMAAHPETETLGQLDPAFLGAHQEHMKDEARHLHIDGALIDLCIAAGGPMRRALNAHLFKSMLGGVVTPTRGGSGVKVIRQLVRDMPELKSREEEMIQAVLALKDNEAFQKSLFNRAIMPTTFRLFNSSAELASLGERMVGYDRR